MGWAREHWLRSAILLSVISSACLVTDKPEFGEPNTPASLLIKAPSSLSRAPLMDDPLCDGRYMGFEVEIADANIADELIGRLLVNDAYAIERPIPTTGQVVRGKLRLCATRRQLSNRCNHVELVVSNRFGGDGKYDVVDPADVAVVEWWVLPSADVDPMAVTDDCERLFDGGTL